MDSSNVDPPRVCCDASLFLLFGSPVMYSRKSAKAPFIQVGLLVCVSPPVTERAEIILATSLSSELESATLQGEVGGPRVKTAAKPPEVKERG